MVATLARIVSRFRVAALEAVGVGCIIAGLTDRFGSWTGLVAGGVAAVLKATEIASRGEG